MMALVASLAANAKSCTKMKKVIMYFMEIICESSFSDDQLKQYSGDLNHLFQAYLGDADMEVKNDNF